MKKLIPALTGILLLIILASAGCNGQETAVPETESPLAVSTCVTCHTDKEILKEVASPVVEEAKSEETVGEG